MAQSRAAAQHGWSLTGLNDTPIPYLSYEPSTFLGTVVDHTIGDRKLPLDLRYMDALAEALKRRTLAGGGLAWLPEFAIREELESGALVQIGSSRLEAVLTLSLFCSPEKLDETGLAIWDSF